MLSYKIIHDKQGKAQHIETQLHGKALLKIPQLNKGTAFSQEERKVFRLSGKLPSRIETLEEQVKRTYEQFCSYKTKLQQHIFLNNLHETNQVLFYKLLNLHLTEMLPIIYTPVIGAAVISYSLEFRHPRGLCINYQDVDRIEEILENPCMCVYGCV